MDIELSVQHRLANRDAVQRLQEEILAHPNAVPASEFPVAHHYAPGMYAREMLIPADSVIVGKIHRHAHVNVISAGRVRVFTEHTGVLEFSAPYTFVSEPGAKRVVYALEDTVWTTIHSTDSTDPAYIEREVIATQYEELT